MKKIAEVLDISTDYLLDYECGNITLSSQEADMINLLRKLNKDERNAILNLLKTFAGK